jgi:hypothetical protein
MGSHRLTLADRKFFREFLSLRPHELSVYTFANIYIWRGIFDINWRLIDKNLCVFFQDKTGCFLYFPPLGVKPSLKAVEESFRLMDACNKNPAVSRLENVEEKDIDLMEKLGYRISPKPGEYLCSGKTLRELKGDGFKSKRAAINFFTKHYRGRYREFLPEHKDACLGLYKFWSAGRRALSSDPVYKGMLKDSLSCLEITLNDYKKLDLTARVVEIDGQVKAFTAGFRINPETFCVLFEFADLAVKGLSQYIFREFCRELEGYKYINIMDDSGLNNLKVVKESYRPLKMIPAFIADRRNA